MNKFKVGDRVVVVRRSENVSAWMGEMDKVIGLEGTINKIREEWPGGYYITFPIPMPPFFYPEDCLEHAPSIDVQAEANAIINDAMMWRAWMHNRNQLGKTRPETKAATKRIVATVTAKVARGEMDRELRI